MEKNLQSLWEPSPEIGILGVSASIQGSHRDGKIEVVNSGMDTSFSYTVNHLAT